MPSNQIHFFLHALPANQSPEVSGGIVQVSADQLDAPFGITFESLCQQIDTLPGAYTEPDGAIGWNPAGGNGLGGTIHCIDERVICVEFFSKLDQVHLEKIVNLCCPNRNRFVAQLAEQGRFVTIDQLIALAPCPPLQS